LKSSHVLFKFSLSLPASQHEIRKQFKEAAFVEIVPDSSQANKLALKQMRTMFRAAEHVQVHHV
jgi:hypothetical protein